MDISKLVDLLQKHEGIRKFPYMDSVGKLTIGCGHNLTDKGLTTPQIISILNDDIKDTIAWMNKNIPWYVQLDAARQIALADLTFDLMGKVLDFKKMLAALQTKDWNTVADELLNSTFAHQTGQRAKDLAEIFRTGVING